MALPFFPRPLKPEIPPLAAHPEFARLAKRATALEEALAERNRQLLLAAIESDLERYASRSARQQSDRFVALRDRAAALRKMAPAEKTEVPSADGMPASVRRALALVAGEKIDEPLDRDGRLKHLRSEKAIIEKALADLNSLMEEIKGEQSRLVAEQLIPEYRKLQRHIYDLAAALTAAVEAERQFYIAPIMAGYMERPDILGRRRLDAAARLGTFDAWDSQISSFKRELISLGVV